MTANERIKQVRQCLKLSQAKFAKDISISNGYIAGIELGNRKVNDRIIKLICSQYNVSELWLRDGIGEMFSTTPDSRLEHLTIAFRGLKPEFQDYVLSQLDQLLLLQKNSSDTKAINEAASSAAGIDIDAEVESYRRELEAQKKAADVSSASAGQLSTEEEEDDEGAV